MPISQSPAGPPATAGTSHPVAAAAAELVARVRAELPDMAGLPPREELLAAASLRSLRSARTRRAHAGDLRAWLAWLADRGADVLAAGRVYADLWVAGQQDQGSGPSADAVQLLPGSHTMCDPISLPPRCREDRKGLTAFRRSGP